MIRLKLQKVVAVIAGLAGLVFLFNGGTDIQLGFGLVLVFQGILGWPDNHEFIIRNK